MVLIPDNYAQVNYKFTGVAVPLGAQVTLGVALANPAAGPDDVATTAAAGWTSSIRNEQVSEITLASVLVKFGPNDLGPSTEQPVGLAGTAAAGSAAPNTAVLVRKVTALGGHAGRGRMFIPGILETQVGSNGFITPSALTGWQDELDNFFTFMEASDLPPVVLHSEGSPLSTPTEIVQLIVDPRVATQRRRLRK